MNLKFFLLELCILSLLAACESSQKRHNYIDLAEHIKEDKKTVTLNEWVKDYRIIRVDDQEILLNSHRICKVTKDYIVLVNLESVCFINKNTGIVEHLINRKGRGAEEYLEIGACVVDEENQSVYLGDWGKGNIIQYTYDGDIVKEIRDIKEVSDFKMNQDGSLWVCYNPKTGTEYMLGKYDSTFVLQQQYLQKKSTEYPIDIFSYNSIQEYNGLLYFQPENCDTIYNISKIPFEEGLIVHMGKLRIPSEIKDNVRRKAERKNYIWGEYGLWIDDIYFITYFYNDQKYQDIWNTDQSDLLFRNIMKSPDSDAGIELLLKEGSLRVWPSYASGGYLYCLIGGIDAHKLFPQCEEDSNGFILEMKLK